MKGFLNKLGFFKKKEHTVQTVKTSVRPVQKTVRKNVRNRFRLVLSIIGLLLFCVVALSFTIRGNAGNPTPQELNTITWKDKGPLELSPERGRYALLYSTAENNSFTFTPEIAAFATPDVGYHNGTYVSLFAPAVSVMAMPGYYLGKTFGLAQVGAFAVISLFALCNFFLIRAIAMRLGANSAAAAIGAMVFLFASPAFSYAITLYQHHISTFLILLSIFLLMRFNSIFSLLAIWILCGLSIAVDYPNFFMMLPIGIFALGRTFLVEKTEKVVKLSIPVLRVLAIGFIAIPLALFFWFNTISYGSPFTLSGSVERAIEVKKDGSPLLESEVIKKRLEETKTKETEIGEKSIGAFFHPRNLMNGFYTHFISPDRGLMFYTPVMLFGAAGLLFYRKRTYISLFVAVIGFNVVLYSMWGDPYGGWAFGSRYLIPTYAILAIFTAVLLTKLNRYMFFLLMFFLMFTYSVSINTLGAITSGMNPPRVEAEELERKSGKPQPYTYIRNMHLLDQNISKSFVYQTYFKERLSAWEYYVILTSFIVGTGAVMLLYLAAPSSAKANKSAKVKTLIAAGKERYAI